MRKKRKKRNNKIKKFFIMMVLLIIAGLGGFAGYSYKNIQNYQNIILPGVKINGIDVSNKTFEEAQAIVRQKYYTPIQKASINIRYMGKTHTIKFSDLEAKYNIDETIKSAVKYGKDLGIIKEYKLIKNPEEKNFELTFTYNSAPIENAVKSIETEVNKSPVNASITKTGKNSFNVKPEVIGKKLNTDKLIEEINDNIQKTKGESFTVDAPIEDLVPKITSKELNQINALISSYSTNYSTSSYERSTNIELATKSINGTVLMPGDVFSFNDVVGERTAQRGYKEAHVIVGNKIENGLGGGICQVSSTLYNSVLGAGLYSVERAHHTIPSSYVPYGRDATVSYGTIDYKFKNTFKYPIYIEAYTKDKNVYFNLYSNDSLKNKTYSIRNEIYDTIKPKIVYEDDPNLEEGETEIVQKPYTGYKVKLYRDVFENGKLVKTELISNDYYKQVTGLIKRGTKKKTKTTEMTQVTEATNN